MTVSQNCLGTQRKSNHLSRFGPHIHRKPTLVTTERCWVWRCPRAQPRDGPTGPSSSTLPAPARSYLQQEVTQVLVAIQEAENRCPELCGAPKGAFPFPGSPCWEVWVSLGTEACSMPQHPPPRTALPRPRFEPTTQQHHGASQYNAGPTALSPRWCCCCRPAIGLRGLWTQTNPSAAPCTAPRPQKGQQAWAVSCWGDGALVPGRAWSTVQAQGQGSWGQRWDIHPSLHLCRAAGSTKGTKKPTPTQQLPQRTAARTRHHGAPAKPTPPPCAAIGCCWRSAPSPIGWENSRRGPVIAPPSWWWRGQEAAMLGRAKWDRLGCSRNLGMWHRATWSAGTEGVGRA